MRHQFTTNGICTHCGLSTIEFFASQNRVCKQRQLTEETKARESAASILRELFDLNDTKIEIVTIDSLSELHEMLAKHGDSESGILRDQLEEVLQAHADAQLLKKSLTDPATPADVLDFNFLHAIDQVPLSSGVVQHRSFPAHLRDSLDRLKLAGYVHMRTPQRHWVVTGAGQEFLGGYGKAPAEPVTLTGNLLHCFSYYYCLSEPDTDYDSIWSSKKILVDKLASLGLLSVVNTAGKNKVQRTQKGFALYSKLASTPII